MTSSFTPPANDSYVDAPARMVPGYDGLLRMASMLLAERVPQNGRVLVLGAGGGLELKSFADTHSGWTFDGVDPSEEMLRLAKVTVGPHIDRMHLHEGTIESAPDVLFDAATSILVFHFIPKDQRLETLRQVRRRLKVGAPFVLAHVSFPQSQPERATWIKRHVAFASPEGTDPARVAKTEQAIATKLTILSPEEEVDMLRDAGFSSTSLFYAGLSFKGWVTYAA